MILTGVFCLFSVIAAVRLCAFARFTAREKNGVGAASLYIFAAIIVVCAAAAAARL